MSAFNAMATVMHMYFAQKGSTAVAAPKKKAKTAATNNTPDSFAGAFGELAQLGIPSPPVFVPAKFKLDLESLHREKALCSLLLMISKPAEATLGADTVEELHRSQLEAYLIMLLRDYLAADTIKPPAAQQLAATHQDMKIFLAKALEMEDLASDLKGELEDVQALVNQDKATTKALRQASSAMLARAPSGLAQGVRSPGQNLRHPGGGFPGGVK